MRLAAGPEPRTNPLAERRRQLRDGPTEAFGSGSWARIQANPEPDRDGSHASRRRGGAPTIEPRRPDARPAPSPRLAPAGGARARLGPGAPGPWARSPAAAGVLMVAGLVPWLLTAPWLFGERLLVPTAELSTMVPGGEFSGTKDPFDATLNDAVLQFLPWELEVRHALARGRLPFWSDQIDGGCDLWANLQAQILSPIALLSRLVPIQSFLLVGLVLKLLVASTGTWLLARALGVRGPAAALAAASFAYGGALLPWPCFPTVRRRPGCPGSCSERSPWHAGRQCDH